MGAEVALAFVLLFSAGLFVSSYTRLRDAALGFDPHGVLTMRVVPGGSSHSSVEERRRYFGRILDAAENAGATHEAAITNGRPLDYPAGVRVARADAPLSSLARVVTPGYFRVMGIGLLRGREFGSSDSAEAPRVAIVNENLARALFGAENPVGRRLTLLADGDPNIAAGSIEIVGVARNSKELGVDEVPFQDVYLPFAQSPMRSMYVVMRTNVPAERVAAAMRAELRTADPDGVLLNVSTMEETLRGALRGARFHLALVGVFAVLAVLLAAVGVYGAVAFSSAQRMREFALRIALGALPRAIVKLTLAHMARLALTGALAGLGTALVLGKMLKSALYMAPHLHSGMLYGVTINDPVLLGGAAALVAGVAAAASLTPAARASLVQPSEVLRHE